MKYRSLSDERLMGIHLHIPMYNRKQYIALIYATVLLLLVLVICAFPFIWTSAQDSSALEGVGSVTIHCQADVLTCITSLPVSSLPFYVSERIQELFH